MPTSIMCLFRSFAQWVVFLLLNLMNSLYLLATSPLSDTCFCINKYFLLLCGLSFLFFFNSVFQRPEVLNFNEAQFINFSFYGSCFCILSKKSFPNPRSQGLSSIFYSRSFIKTKTFFKTQKYTSTHTISHQSVM